MALLNVHKLRLRATYWLAMGVATAARLEVACDDPPVDIQAGRLLTLPGDAAGAALVVSDASLPPAPSPDAGSSAGEIDEDDASAGDEIDAASADGAGGS
jgi:hypothetical protein